ncbi:PEP-utilizing enzyme [Nocardioides sp. WS12]|uniref:PEP-utilizing enzyme n=1 Tax=Nocardioides sp. WS12 TaxID=2486272 RepID=UPI00191FAE74|nr:PEP-utilizing enzyme [Nocardioides sp. WS12]
MPQHPTDEDVEVLHAVAPLGSSWSSINLAEAVPGVMTPLTASAWVPASETGLRLPFHAMGVLETARKEIPADPADRITNAFFGRMAVRVDFLCEIGDLVPGQSGEALSRDFFGYVPPGYESNPSLRRVPFILARYPRTLATIARRVEDLRARTDAWWRVEIARMDTLDLAASQRLVVEADRRFAESLAAQALISAAAIQPIQEHLDKLAQSAGVDGSALLRGTPHEESAVLGDLWLVSRGTLSLDEFLRRHGYHGPGEGEVATRVWREDPEPVRRIVAQYAAKPDHEAPDARHADHRAERERAEAAVMATAGGAAGRLKARLVLRLARRFIPLRGVGKVSYLQSLDVLRGAARRVGADLVAADRLDHADDTTYLTVQELGDPFLRYRPDLRATVDARKLQRREFQQLTVPSAWTGQPVPQEVVVADDPAGALALAGIGACPGVVEGRVVVAHDPSNVEIEEGDILVAHTTDPAWVSLMFLSGALVVDIGGLMSHAAVVARELDIPCVMNTGTGTRVLRDGDLVRVDGRAGTVEVLERASLTTTHPEGVTA